VDINWEYLGDLPLLSDCSEPVLPLEGWSLAGSDRGAGGERRDGNACSRTRDERPLDPNPQPGESLERRAL
jgi:hypothetical protein